MRDNVIDQIKIWLTPSVVSIIGIMIWSDMQEMKSDIKALLQESSSQREKIKSLEQDVALIKGTYFKATSSTPTPKKKDIPPAYMIPFAKHEESFDIDKYLPNKPTSHI
jgi:hypothetical protein